MMFYVYSFSFGCFCIALTLNLIQILRSSEPSDRILALDTMFINAIALMILYGLVNGTEVFFEAALIMAMLGFISTVAYTRFLLRGNIIE